MKIFSAITAIMAEIGAVGKDQKNTAQGYSFRGIDDIYAAAQLVMAKHGVCSFPEVLEERTEERTTKSGTALIYRVMKIKYTFYAEDGSSVPCIVVGEGMDSGDKAANKAMSAAEKYSLIQVFKIPTREAKDSEHDSHEVEPKQRQETEGFDPKNPTHTDWLKKQLRAQKIADDQATVDKVSAVLKGKPPEALSHAIKEGLK